MLFFHIWLKKRSKIWLNLSERSDSHAWPNLAMIMSSLHWRDNFQNQAWLTISRTLRSVQLQKRAETITGGVARGWRMFRNLGPVRGGFGPGWTVSAGGPWLLKDKCISLFHYSWAEEVARERGARGLAQQCIPSQPCQGRCPRCTHTLLQESGLGRGGEGRAWAAVVWEQEIKRYCNRMCDAFRAW